jgi:curli biogenesis system outer membrane secretion channel CsgG
MIMFMNLLHGCSTIPEHESLRTVAVWDLENRSPGAFTMPDLGLFLSGEIIQAIKQSGDIQVVEREKLVSILEELKLGSSELSEKSTRLKVGRMMGAKEMVFGSYMVVGSTMRIDLRRVDVETGKVVKAAKKTAEADDLAGWLKAAHDATTGLYSR